MDKYLSAIIGYERARQNIAIITKSIIDCRIERGCKCQYIGGDFGQHQSCLDAYYQYRKNKALVERCEAAHYHEAGDAGCGEDIFFEEPKLCSFGIKVNDLVQKRKAAKKQFGIEKRRISALAKCHL